MKYITKKLLAVFSVLLLATTIFAADTKELAIIPLPQKIQPLDGVFQLTARTRIYTDPASFQTVEFLTPRGTARASRRDPSSFQTGEFLAGYLRKSTGYYFKVSGKTMPGMAVTDGILLTTDDADASLGDEGYALTVTTNAIVIRAPTQAGLFYGVQTLLQLLPPQIFSSHAVADVNWQIPAVQITDWPRFKWRGFMLDVSRHFYDKAEVEKILDTMALYKLNTLHWHLTDDQGWRIEIKKYPKLVAIGAWRDGVGFDLPTNSTTAYGPDGRYGGFYTQDDIREVVACAQKLHINIIPEIEMPGHSLAALAAYPQFGTGDGPFAVLTEGGVNPGIYSPAKDGTFEFLDNVLAEVFQLFPSQYIHIGGDEVTPGPWEKDAACQALMKREGLKTPDELESWFIRRIEKFVNANGKTLVGWSEIARGGLAKNAVVMDWIGGGREAANAGHDVVMTPTSYCYFDQYQARDHSGEPKAMGYAGDVTLAKVYSFEPIPGGLAPEMQDHILGGQGNLWTEFVPNLKHAEYMVFPRLCALAEVTWSAKAARNFNDFTRRLKTDNQRLDQLGVNYRPNRPDTRTQIGGWTPAQIKSEPAPLEWDVTKNVIAAGKCRVGLDYTEGACGINIAWVALLEDGREISRDTHAGFTGDDPRNSIYTLDVPGPKPGAHYTLRAQVAGSDGTDSTGSVFWKLKPATTSQPQPSN